MGESRAVCWLILALAARVPVCDDWQLVAMAKANIVESALKTPDSAWAFITSADARLPERIAVANRIALPASFLPKVVAATLELDREWELHHWGLQISQYDSSGGDFGARVPEGGTTRRVLGQPFVVPRNRVDYPETCAARLRAPWPWQVQHVIIGAEGSIARAPAAEYDRALLTLPCTTAEELRGVREALANRRKLSRDFATPVFMGVWRNVVARDHGLYGGEAALKRYADKPSQAVPTCASSSTP